MKKLITILLIAGPLATLAQVSDSFTDGDYSQNPSWTGDTTLFEVNASEQLHLSAASADTAYLSTGCGLPSEAEWRFWMKMSFNTSANNYCRIYLASDMQDLEGPLNGYFLQAGGSEDSIALYHQQGITVTRLLCCNRLFTGHSTNVFRFRITCDAAGNWEIRADSTGGINFIQVGSYCDPVILSSSFFGPWCRFTSSNSSKFYFDDFYAGPVQYDSIAPKAIRAEICGIDSLQLFFSEPVDQTTATDTSNYHLSGTGEHPLSAVPGDDSIVLVFSSAFPDAYCDSLVITGVTDLSGIVIDPASLPFCHFHPGQKDVVINEILADPYENGSRFIELYNRAGMPVDLRELVLSYYSTDSASLKTVSLTTAPHYLQPFSYAVSCDDLAGMINRYPASDTACFFQTTSFPALAAAGGTVILSRTSDKAEIDKVIYSETMHHPLLTSTEGISLERISPDASSLDAANWHSAAASAGDATPGMRNSQYWVQGTDATSAVTLDPQVFSPDNDGKDDLLHIICHPSGNDFMATVIIYDSRGRRVRLVAGNERIASEGIFTWDGITGERTKASAGIYIVYVELIRMDGIVERYRKATAVAVKF